jgi:GT2 family glycosyltransferase
MSAGAVVTSMVVPSHNRADALRTNLPNMLALEGVGELIVVIADDTVDHSAEVVEAIDDPRLRLVRKPGPAGTSAQRNFGVRAASGGWIQFGEDDCRFPNDYVSILRSTAESHDAQIVGAPWMHVAPGVDPLKRLAELRTTSPGRPRLDAHGGVPSEVIETPFIPAPALVRRDVFDHIAFDDGYTGNAYREETAFFIAATRAGYRCLLTPFTASYQERQWQSGGARMPPIRYELSALRNNWRFLRLHGDWLTERGHIAGKLRFQAAFAAERMAKIVKGVITSRLARRTR